eukprot:gene3126-5296_t
MHNKNHNVTSIFWIIEKEDYIEAIEECLGEKQKVNFTLYTFAAEEGTKDKSVVIRKHNITTYVTKTKIEKLKEYNMEKSELEEANMVRDTPSYDSLSAIENLIGYFKMLDFHVLSTNGGFSLRTTPLKNQTELIEPKINQSEKFDRQEIRINFL